MQLNHPYVVTYQYCNLFVQLSMIFLIFCIINHLLPTVKLRYSVFQSNMRGILYLHIKHS
uniref:Uncharacterized protein n=1 Tax=Oryza brachyantha TaxID=4533 RepID=J3KXZ5_ORYBR